VEHEDNARFLQRFEPEQQHPELDQHGGEGEKVVTM
jgi:hypothetical protein